MTLGLVLALIVAISVFGGGAAALMLARSPWLSPVPPGRRCVMRLPFGLRIERLWGSPLWIRPPPGSLTADDLRHALWLGWLVVYRDRRCSTS